jgi:hypothetical protein
MQVVFRISTILILVAMTALVPTQAKAGLTVEADVVVTDDAGGTLTLISSATHERIGSNVITTATFADFRPRADGRTLDGDIVRVRNRDVDSLESTYDGSLAIRESDDGAVHSLVLENLTVNREGEGPEFAGTVVYNGQAYEAEELPARLAAALRHVLRLFHFA